MPEKELVPHGNCETANQPDLEPTDGSPEGTERVAKPGRAYPWLGRAVDRLIRDHFDGHLEPPHVTLQSRANPLGSFSIASVANIANSSETRDRIILSQAATAAMTDIAVLVCLATQLVGIDQHHHGKPCRLGYHDRAYAAAMKRIGLIFSETDEIGGKETGEKLNVFVVEDGPFDRCAKAFLAEEEAVFYQDRAPVDEAEAERIQKQRQKRNKTAYRCACGKVTAWSKPDINLFCDCLTKMTP
jgi:hypothetical protein